KDLSQTHANLPTIGRTHGIHAEPTTLGLKFASFLAEGFRQNRRLRSARYSAAVGKLSGSVGNFASSLLTPDQEVTILKHLGLRAEPVATQIVCRDRHAEVICALAQAGCWIERIATEFRHLQRTEIAELSEPFAQGKQHGSSSMPHKRNPILSENLCGLARLLRGYAMTALENTALWHERDISHSSAERVLFPDAFSTLHFMLGRLNVILRGINIDQCSLRQNLTIYKDLSSSQAYLNSLILSGMDRRQAYKLIQQASFNVLKGSTTLWDELAAQRIPGIRRIATETLTRHASALVKRALRQEPDQR
ncbi:MAG: lyase family protein, partial [Elusimicrobiota bacterium]